MSPFLMNLQHLGVKVTAFPVCGLCCYPGLHDLQGEQECAQEPPELVECGCAEEPMPSGSILVIAIPCSFPMETSNQQLQHLWELSALEDLMITTAAVGEKEPGSV